MSTNGGTLHQGIPPSPRANYNCAHCGVLLDSIESLNVHLMHYHSESIHCWSQQSNAQNKSSTASNSPTDSENNNQPKMNIQSSSKNGSPSNSTISAAADSSDNQPSTTQPSNHHYQLAYQYLGLPSTFQRQPVELPGSWQDLYYPNIEYPQLPFTNQSLTQHEYKTVPSTRYQPYPQISSIHSVQHNISARNVTSSSPTQNNLLQSSSPLIQHNQSTPSPSPNQCDKCGHLSETDSQLRDHYSTAHCSSGHSDLIRHTASNEETGSSSFPYNSYVKVEREIDILDMDTHKMVYSPNTHHNQHGPLPPVQSLTALQKQPMWHQDHASFEMSLAHDPKLSYFTPNISKEFSSVRKQEYMHQQQDAKQFSSDVSGNQLTSSPSEFPTTTTPQENGAQFRTSFEAATSSLPTNTPTGKSASWKSNEARRPKTYNCTACNKWFTSSGHLKRHYNTTLHKNAVKSSGQPDPALMPISIHHHPTRDQNKSNHHNRGSPAQPPSVPPVPEQSGSPDYTQFAPPSGFPNQTFQQYQSNLSINSTTGSSPNGQAGPSVHASQQRGLLTQTNNTGTYQVLPQEQHQQTTTQQAILCHTTNIPDTYTTHNTSNSILPQYIQHLGQNYNIIIGSDDDKMEYMIQPGPSDYSSFTHSLNENSYVTYNAAVPNDSRRFSGGCVPQQFVSVAQFSPDTPDSCNTVSLSPQDSASQQRTTIPIPSPLPSPSPSTSTSTSTSTSRNVRKTPKVAENTVPFCCKLCNKHFQRLCYFTQHNKSSHSPILRPFKCQKCGKSFQTEDCLNQHINKHTTEDKPFPCTEVNCSKAFNHKTDLRRHMCVHYGVKPYKCPTCNKGFIRQDHMVKHTETHKRKFEKKQAAKLAAATPFSDGNLP